MIDHDRQHDLVLVEPQQRVRVGQQDAGVEDVACGAGGAAAGVVSRCGGSHDAGSPGGVRPAHGQRRTSVVTGTGLAVRRAAPSREPGCMRRVTALPRRCVCHRCSPRRCTKAGLPDGGRGVHRPLTVRRAAAIVRHAGPADVTGVGPAALRTAGSGAEAALPRGVRAQRPQEVDLAEVRPVGLAEVELRVRALPEQEAGQPLLAATCGSPGRGRAGPWCRGARRCARRRGPRRAPRSTCPRSACSCSSERTASAISRRPP